MGLTDYRQPALYWSCAVMRILVLKLAIAAKPTISRYDSNSLNWSMTPFAPSVLTSTPWL